MRFLAALGLALWMFLGITGCADTPVKVPVTVAVADTTSRVGHSAIRQDKKVASITVTPDSVKLERGDTTILTCTPKNKFGTPLSTGCTWRSSDTLVAKVTTTITQTMKVRAIQAGTAKVIGWVPKYSNLRDTVTVFVTDTVGPQPPDTTTPPPCSPSATVICPGDNWQAKVNAAPTGTVFTIGAGVHRGQSVVAKQGQQFKGQPGAIMSGAKLLTGWTQSGSTWWVGGQTQEFGHTTGECISGTACLYPEDVYRNDMRLKRELTLAAVGPGEMFFDYATDRIYVGDNPAGAKLEAAATEYAFMGSPDGSGPDVVLDGLIIEKYANQGQYGAIGRSNMQRGWTVRNCEIRWNHGAGLRTGAVKILNSKIHHNGQIGMVGGGDQTTLIQGNEVYHNNTAGYRPEWEAGGIKFGGGLMTGIIASKNNIHDNDGIGLWFDGYGDQFRFDSNTVVNNTWDGIKVEISYGGTVRGNTVTGNGFANPHSEEGDGIMVYAAGGAGLEISGNTLSGNKHAIMLFAADRGSGPAGPLITKNVNVHHNTITLSGSQRTGAVRYNGSTGLWTTDNNHFEDNTYNLQSAPASPFIWTNNAAHSDAQWKAAGNDETGMFNR